MKRVRVQSEEGAVAVVTALLLVALVMTAAVVVDLGLLRADKATSQYVSDAAAAAGALELDGSGASFENACDAAWDYVVRNLPDVPDTEPSPCAGWYGSATCSAGIVPPKSIDLGPVIIEMTMPVDSSDPMMTGQASNTDFDGSDACERIGVKVLRERNFLLAGVAGFSDGLSYTAAVGLAPSSDEEDFATLIVLDRTRCNALTTTGQGKVVVENIDPYTFPDGTTGPLPGLIQVDSAASYEGGGSLDCKSGHVMDASSNGLICGGVPPARAQDIFDGISTFCDSLPDSIMTLADEDHDAPADDVLAGRVDSDPKTIAEPVTRSIVDHRVNCRSYGSAADPQHPVDDIEDCPYTGQVGAHIDELVDAYVTPTASSPPTVPSSVTWTHLGVGGTQSCADLRADPATLPAGNYYINCPGPSGSDSLSISTGESLRIDGPSTVIINGDVSVSGSGAFSLNANNPAPATVPATNEGLDSLLILRDGEFAASGSSEIRLERTFGYLHTGALKATSDNITWEAPVDRSYTYDRQTDSYSVPPGGCTVDADDVPSNSCFGNLAAWTNAHGEHSLGGSGAMDLGGVFFIPNAGRSGTTTQFDINGSVPQNLRHAQFFAHRIRVTGSGTIRMRPDPDRIFPLPASQGGLIR